MSTLRFRLPEIGPPVAARFPSIDRTMLDSGLGVWSIAHTSVPVVTAQLLVQHGAADDPATLPGLAGVTADMLDEAAGPYDAIQLADAFARLGSQLTIEVGSDVTSLSFTSLSRFFPQALELAAEVVLRPRFAAADLDRVRDLRLSRLRQLSSSAGAAADRAFYGAVFGSHPYGHGVVGTTAALGRIRMDDVRGFYDGAIRPETSVLIVAGDIGHADVVSAARGALGAWRPASTVARTEPPAPVPSGEASTYFVARPHAPQSEVRVGHVGPPRLVPAYHALLALNAALGGQFSSRLNTTLRERKGLTYGVHTAFDFRRVGGTFTCESSVQASGTGEAIAEVLAEFGAVRTDGAITIEELARAKAALTRGYVRHFETADQLARAAVQLATYGLDDDTYDRFVPAVEAVTETSAVEAAREFIRPDRAVAVVVGDPDQCGPQLETLNRPIHVVTPEF